MLITSKLTEVTTEIDDILRKNFGKQLFYPKQDDQIRLLRLKMWSERYKVSMTYILSVLIPHFERLANKHRGHASNAKSKGIGTTIATLTGQVSEALLEERITKDFPDGENVIAWKQERQQECLEKLRDDGIGLRKPKGMLRYPTLSRYVKAYRSNIEGKRQVEERQKKKLARQPWRDNPFR